MKPDILVRWIPSNAQACPTKSALSNEEETKGRRPRSQASSRLSSEIGHELQINSTIDDTFDCAERKTSHEAVIRHHKVRFNAS